MKFKAVLVGNVPADLRNTISSVEFAKLLFNEIVGKVFGVPYPATRPAEYYMQQPDEGVSVHGSWGVIMNLTGVSRGNRPSKLFHEAIKRLHGPTAELVHKTVGEGNQAQVFAAIMLDGDIETQPGSGQYSSVIESSAEWIDGRAIPDEPRPENDPSSKE